MCIRDSNELADLVGAVWRVDNQKKFYFIVKEEFPQFPHTINKDFLLGSELQHKTKDYMTRTVQYITGEMCIRDRFYVRGS